MIHFLIHWLGLSNASGPQYLFWSGIFGDVTIFAAVITYYTHTRCHVDTCHKRGKYPFQHYKLCWNHHPNVPNRLTHLHIAKLHKSATLKK